jgi:uncharacterized glyoxalase superfamily protein PhnB
MKLNPYLSFDGRCREAFEFNRPSGPADSAW